MTSLQLQGKFIISGDIKLLTGLHIGGAAAGLDIGGIDNPIIRHPATREPYIPGSSLRGKMRSLLDKHFGNDANIFIQKRPVVRVHECKEESNYTKCQVCQIFGVSPSNEGWKLLKPTRLLVRDVHLSKEAEETMRLRNAKTDLPFTEIKTEATIDRITSAAVPRQNERVPAETVFGPFELIYSLYDLDGAGCKMDIDNFQYVIKAMELLEDDSLGGYGSRGAGKITFRNITTIFKSRNYYDGKANLISLENKKDLREMAEELPRFTSEIMNSIASQ